MNHQYITDYFLDNQKETGILKIYYDFSGISGLFVPNRLFEGSEQFGSINSNYFINKQYSPGIFISCYGQQEYTGSGIFQGGNNLKVLNNLSGDNITLFYNFSDINCDKNFTVNNINYQIPTGYTKVLSYIESKDNSKKFEIILGLNDLNKLTLEFSGQISGSNEIYKSTNFAELANQNICALRLNSKYIEYTYFDMIEDEIYNQKIDLTGNYFKQEKNIYIGNIPTGSYRNFYTGYYGILDDFVAYDEYIPVDNCAELSKIFLKTGERFEYVTVTGFSYNIIQSGFVNPTGILGTGIVGYELVPSNEIIDVSCGQDCTVYIKSGITGLITGEKIEYVIVDQAQFQSSQQAIKYNLYDENYASRFAKNNIIFNSKLDDQDILEVQFYKDLSNKIEYPDYAIIDQTYIAQDNLNGKNLLIFINGVNIRTGDYTITSENNKFKIQNYNKDFNDLVYYSISDYTGSKYTNINYTGDPRYAPPLTYNGSIFYGLNRDWIGNRTTKDANIFINGQKLISGLDYRLTRIGPIQGFIFEDLYIRSGITTGRLNIVTDNYISRITGSNLKIYYNSGLAYSNERIWVNGIYQNKNENYILTSCSNSALFVDKEFFISNESIFDGEDYRFNLV